MKTRILALTALTAVIAGCGGGGSDTAPAPAPVAVAAVTSATASAANLGANVLVTVQGTNLDKAAPALR